MGALPNHLLAPVSNEPQPPPLRHGRDVGTKGWVGWEASLAWLSCLHLESKSSKRHRSRPTRAHPIHSNRSTDRGAKCGGGLGGQQEGRGQAPTAGQGARTVRPTPSLHACSPKASTSSTLRRRPLLLRFPLPHPMHARAAVVRRASSAPPPSPHARADAPPEKGQSAAASR